MILPNRIYQMDILQGIKYLPDKSIKLIVADPPYFLGMTHNGQKGSFVDLAICAPFFAQLFTEFERVLQDDGEVFFFCDFRSYAFFYPIFNSILSQKNLIVWDKGNMAGNHYNFNHEFIIFGMKQGFSPNRGGTNVWRSNGFSSGAKKTNGEKVHDTQKTVEVIAKIITDASSEGDAVLDAFAGSGTTSLVARELGRISYGFELDLKNFEIARKRHENGFEIPFIDISF